MVISNEPRFLTVVVVRDMDRSGLMTRFEVLDCVFLVVGETLAWPASEFLFEELLAGGVTDSVREWRLA